FFFQADDGIRDRTVTGVQTCAFRSGRMREYTCSTEVEGSGPRAYCAFTASSETSIASGGSWRKRSMPRRIKSSTRSGVRLLLKEIGRASCRERVWSAGVGCGGLVHV